MRHRPKAVAPILLATLALTLAGCGEGATRVTPPAPTGAAAEACTALADALPAELDGADRTTTEPDSPFTAAWSGIVLTCGGEAPDIAPDAQVFAIGDVEWLPDPLPQGGTRFVTRNRVAVVAVTVPVDREPASGVLVDLSPSIATHLTPTAPKSPTD